MISTSKQHVEHPFAGRNTQHTVLFRASNFFNTYVENLHIEMCTNFRYKLEIKAITFDCVCIQTKKIGPKNNEINSNLKMP